MRTINFILKESPIRKDILDVFDGEAFALRTFPGARGSQEDDDHRTATAMR